jgi:hypothetical protein
MKVTFNVFRTLCNACSVTARITDLIRGMRCKSDRGDEHFTSCYTSVQGGSVNTSRHGGPTPERQQVTKKKGLEFGQYIMYLANKLQRPQALRPLLTRSNNRNML